MGDTTMKTEEIITIARRKTIAPNRRISCAENSGQHNNMAELAILSMPGICVLIAHLFQLVGNTLSDFIHLLTTNRS